MLRLGLGLGLLDPLDADTRKGSGYRVGGRGEGYITKVRVIVTESALGLGL